MAFRALPFGSTIDDYRRQADELYAGWQGGHPDAIHVFRTKHPAFLDDRIPWLPRRMSDAEARAIAVDRDDARLASARWYDYQHWSSLEEHVAAIQRGGAVARFETAVEAVVDGDAATLRALLREDPVLTRARSTRVNCFDPPVHGATLLHYVAANGVETYRQRSPKNPECYHAHATPLHLAIANGRLDVAKALIDHGARLDLQDSIYQGTPLGWAEHCNQPRIAEYIRAQG
jgi:hypothetical protein